MPAPQPSGWQRSAGGVVQIARGPKGEKIQLTHDDCGRLIERRVERDGFRPRRWRYRWDGHDRLVGVTTPDGEDWLFRYDPFGRRVSKVRRFAEQDRQNAARRWPNLVSGDGVPQPSRSGSGSDARTRHPDLPEVGTAYLWDGDHMVAEAPLALDGHIAWDQATHWQFEEGSHRLLTKQLPSGEMLAIVSDHLGTPKEMFDAKGTLLWAADHHVWGAIRTTRTFGPLAALPRHDRPPEELHSPWRFPGQYEDAETGLCYNRHRHYDPMTGQYASPDPIGLAGGDRPQGYVANPNTLVDVLGLSSVLFRGERSSRPPEQIFEEGFTPKGSNTNLEEHVKTNTAGSNFIATTPEKPIAIEFAGRNGYVYVLKNRNAISVNKALGDKSPFPEQNEFAIPGGVPSSDILGAYKMNGGVISDEFIPNPNFKK